jgi:rhamnose transport system permease protein
VNASDIPKEFLAIGTGQVLTIPILAIVACVLLVAIAWYMRNTRGGREYFAIGSDPSAAELYGLRVTRRVLAAFVLSGALAGLAGVFYVSRYGTVSSQAGAGWELDAVGAAVIGGVAITGGVGTVWGAAIGAVLLMTINRALPILGIPDFWQRAVVGVLIIGAIVLDRWLAVRQKQRLIEARDQA